MENRTPRSRRQPKRLTHPLICLLWALIVVLVLFNGMMIVKLAAGDADQTASDASSLSSLDKNFVED